MAGKIITYSKHFTRYNNIYTIIVFVISFSQDKPRERVLKASFLSRSS